MNRREDVCPDYGREQQMPPMADAGCEDKINRNVLGTGGTTDFAQLRSRLKQEIDGAIDAYWSAQGNRDYRQMDHLVDVILRARDRLRTIDELEADAKSACT